MKLDGKVGATSDLALVGEGNGGAAEIVEFLKDKKKEMYALSIFYVFCDYLDSKTDEMFVCFQNVRTFNVYHHGRLQISPRKVHLSASRWFRRQDDVQSKVDTDFGKN